MGLSSRTFDQRPARDGVRKKSMLSACMAYSTSFRLVAAPLRRHGGGMKAA
jgi:hypothetical protein